MGRKRQDIPSMSQPLAERLSGLITDTGELAAALGCSVQAVNQYRAGISRPSLENLVKIADYYNVTTDYLLGRENWKTKKPVWTPDDIADANAIKRLWPKAVRVQKHRLWGEVIFVYCENGEAKTIETGKRLGVIPSLKSGETAILEEILQGG